MKQLLSVSLLLGCAATAFAQNNNTVVKRESTTVTTTTTTVADSHVDLLGLETFNFLDATTLPEGMVDLRISGRWVDGLNKPRNYGVFYPNQVKDDDEVSDDQIILTPEIVWGATDRLELFLNVPTWVDGEPREGNYDTYVGGQWRISDLDEHCPIWALASYIRIPTGEGSNGVDANLRLILTYGYESGIRSHFNIWGTYVDTDNYADARDFQYGAVAGFDGPIGSCDNLRWIFDYKYEISHAEGSEPDMLYYAATPDPNTGGGARNTAEAGIQWQINECSKLGFAVQGGLDHAENETPEWAASLTYAYAISR
jgi:hypothetical protein